MPTPLETLYEMTQSYVASSKAICESENLSDDVKIDALRELAGDFIRATLPIVLEDCNPNEAVEGRMLIRTTVDRFNPSNN